MGLHKTADIESRKTVFGDNPYFYSYTIHIEDEEPHMGKVRSCVLVGNKLCIMVAKVDQRVYPFPEPTAHTFAPQFK